MISPVEKGKKSKKELKTYLIIGAAFYLYFVLVMLHYSAIKAANKRLDMFDVINKSLYDVFLSPLNIFPLKGDTFMWIGTLTIIGAFAIFAAYVNSKEKKHDNPDTVNGEAHLMDINELNEYNKKFSAPLGEIRNDGIQNMILSKDIRLAIDGKNTRRNCNILVIGGSGAGKTRFFAGPNILQYNCNFVITDPSGEMLRDYGKALEDHGYEIKVFNLTEFNKSNKYNPFHYIKEEKDVFILVNTLIQNTTPPESHGGDPFWENSEKLLLTALILYLWHTRRDEKEKTFKHVLGLLNMAEVNENDANAESPLDLLFKDLEKKDPENLAVRQYKRFKIGAGKTLKSILISVGVRLQAFDLEDINNLTSSDNFEFERFADTKQAIFVIIPTADTTFNFLVSLLYSQLFSTLYTYAETEAEFAWKVALDPLTNIKVFHAKSREESEKVKKEAEALVKKIKSKGVTAKYNKIKKVYKVYTKDGKDLLGWRGTKEQTKKFIEELKNVKIEEGAPRCPIHVRFILDEFANIGQIPQFSEKLSTVRKYEISCSIILQALAQIKDIYKDKWNTIVANCDTKLFLGTDDTETNKWLSEMLGKRTTTVQNTSWQAKGQGSTSLNKSSIELLTIDQISKMKEDECIVRIRAVTPYYGKKYELTEHPNYNYAMSVKGQFFIPSSDGNKISRRGKALWEQEELGIAVSQQQNNTENKSLPIKAPAKPVPLTKDEKEKRNKDNLDRKNKSNAAKKAVEEEAYLPPNEEENINMLINALNSNFTEPVSDAKIKEAIESSVILGEAPSDATLQFLLT